MRWVRSHLGMLGGALLGRLGTCGLSALLFKGPRGPGRDGGRGAPLPAGLCPPDILRGAVGLGGGDLETRRSSQQRTRRTVHTTAGNLLSNSQGNCFPSSFLSQKNLGLLHGDPWSMIETVKVNSKPSDLQHSHQILSEEISVFSAEGKPCRSSTSRTPGDGLVWRDTLMSLQQP